MKSKEVKQLIQKPVPELERTLREQEEKLRTLIADLRQGKAKNVKEKGIVRKTIARLKTALTSAAATNQK